MGYEEAWRHIRSLWESPAGAIRACEELRKFPKFMEEEGCAQAFAPPTSFPSFERKEATPLLHPGLGLSLKYSYAGSGSSGPYPKSIQLQGTRLFG